MRIAKQEDLCAIIEYLKKDLVNCIYMYMDIQNYGVETDYLTVWIQESNGELEFVAMKYYDSFQVYSSKDQYDIISIKELIDKYQVSMISGKKEIIGKLSEYCEDYFATYGEIFVMDRFHKVNSMASVELADEKDALEIAKLICIEPSFAIHYSVDVLASQLAERIRTKTGRSYIIRIDGNIVAHSATYAENSEIAVISGTIVHPLFRNTDYYLVLSNYIIEQLKIEGKRAYTFAISERMIKYHRIVHNYCGEYGKLEKKNKLVEG